MPCASICIHLYTNNYIRLHKHTSHTYVHINTHHHLSAEASRGGTAVSSPNSASTRHTVVFMLLQPPLTLLFLPKWSKFSQQDAQNHINTQTTHIRIKAGQRSNLTGAAFPRHRARLPHPLRHLRPVSVFTGRIHMYTFVNLYTQMSVSTHNILLLRTIVYLCTLTGNQYRLRPASLHAVHSVQGGGGGGRAWQ